MIRRSTPEFVVSKSPYTAGHSRGVAQFAEVIAVAVGLDDERRRRPRRAALLHDVGKLGVSNIVLEKPGKLDEAEWQAMRSHPVKSEAIFSRVAIFADAARIGGAHHERLDGSGYPRGLRADEIDFETRIVSVADVFDTLTADRPYCAAMPVERALSIIDEGVGKAVDAACVLALKRGLIASAIMPSAPLAA